MYRRPGNQFCGTRNHLPSEVAGKAGAAGKGSDGKQRLALVTDSKDELSTCGCIEERCAVAVTLNGRKLEIREVHIDQRLQVCGLTISVE